MEMAKAVLRGGTAKSNTRGSKKNLKVNSKKLLILFKSKGKL